MRAIASSTSDWTSTARKPHFHFLLNCLPSSISSGEASGRLQCVHTSHIGGGHDGSAGSDEMSSSLEPPGPPKTGAGFLTSSISSPLRAVLNEKTSDSLPPSQDTLYV